MKLLAMLQVKASETIMPDSHQQVKLHMTLQYLQSRIPFYNMPNENKISTSQTSKTLSSAI